MADRGGAVQLHRVLTSAKPPERELAPPLRWVAHNGRAISLTVSGDGKTLYSGGRDGTVRAWRPDPQAQRWDLYRESKDEDIATGPNNRLYVAGRRISVWDLKQRRLIDTFAAADPPWRFIDVSTDGRYLAGCRRGEIALFDLATHRRVRTWPLGKEIDLHRIAISPDGRKIAFADWTRREFVAVYDRKHPERTKNIPLRQCSCLRFSPDGQHLAAGRMDDLLLFDLQSGDAPKVLKGHSSTLKGVEFSPDGRLLATVSDDRLLMIWNAASGEELFSIVAHVDCINTVAFSRDGKTIATGGEDNVVKLWHVATGQPLGALMQERNHIHKIRYSADGIRLAVRGDRQFFVYDVAPHKANFAAGSASEAEFHGLGHVVNGAEDLRNGYAPNDRFVVGTCFFSPKSYRPYYWSQLHGLRTLANGRLYSGTAARGNSQASAVSENGRIICGGGFATGGWRALLWPSPHSVPRAIAPFWSHAEGISGDGKIVVGRHWVKATAKTRPFRWESGKLTFLPLSPKHDHAEAVAITRDGSVILGIAFNSAKPAGATRMKEPQLIRDAQPIIWTSKGVQVLRGFDPGFNWYPCRVSDGGKAAVGFCWSPGHKPGALKPGCKTNAFRWEAGHVELLGEAEGFQHSMANGVSGDGEWVVGMGFRRSAEGNGFDATAFLWNRDYGMRPLAEILARAGATPGGWTLFTATSISHDGTTIVGRGARFDREVWLARLPRNRIPGPLSKRRDDRNSRFITTDEHNATSVPRKKKRDVNSPVRALKPTVKGREQKATSKRTVRSTID